MISKEHLRFLEDVRDIRSDFHTHAKQLAKAEADERALGWFDRFRFVRKRTNELLNLEFDFTCAALAEGIDHSASKKVLPSARQILMNCYNVARIKEDVLCRPIS